MQIITIKPIKIIVPNLAQDRTSMLEEHLNRLVQEMCVTTLQIVLNPKLRNYDDNNPVMPIHVLAYADEHE